MVLDCAWGFTVHTGVIHQNDLFEDDGRRGVQDAVHRPQQSAPGLVVKDDDDARGRQRGAALEGLLDASATESKQSTKMWLYGIIPWWHRSVVITSAWRPQWGVCFSRDTAFENAVISNRGEEENVCN